MVNVDKPINSTNPEAGKPKRRIRNAKLNSSRTSALSFAEKRKLNCSREEAIEELRRWFSDDEAEEYVNSFEEQTGAKITRIATPEEAEQYDGDFWATKDGKESLWCRGNGFWYEEKNLDGSRSACGDSTADEKLNSSSDTGLDGLIDAVKSSDADSYADKFEIMQLNPAYEEELMADAYYKAEQMLSEQLDVPNVMLETSVQQGYGSVDAWAEGGTGEHLASYDFEDESNAVWDIIKNWSGDAGGLVDAVAEKIVDLVSMSTDFDSSKSGKSTADEKLNSSRKHRRRTAMRKKLNSSRKLNCKSGKYKPDNAKGLYPNNWLVNGEGSGTIEDDLPRAKRLFENWLTRAGSAYGIQLHLYTWYLADQKHSQDDITRSLQIEFLDPESDGESSPVDYDGPNAQDFLDDMSEFLDTQLFPAIKREDSTVDMVFIMGGPYGYQEYELNSSKDSSGPLNCGAEDEVKVTTESGNEVSIGDIQIVQNPTTNELALFIKESEDDEIPEGFVVIGKATSAQTELSDADVGEDVGEDLDSSKKKN